MIQTFNKWFDNLPSTKRFLVFLSMMIGSVFLLQLGLNLGSPGLSLVGLANTGLVAMIAGQRAIGKGGIHETIGKVMLGLYVVVVLFALFILFA